MLNDHDHHHSSPSLLEVAFYFQGERVENLCNIHCLHLAGLENWYLHLPAGFCRNDIESPLSMEVSISAYQFRWGLLVDQGNKRYVLEWSMALQWIWNFKKNSSYYQSLQVLLLFSFAFSGVSWCCCCCCCCCCFRCFMIYKVSFNLFRSLQHLYQR